MTQAPAVWQELLGSELVSSEDESWLQQSGFHLSDSSDDENSNLLSQAYVNAVAQLKVSCGRSSCSFGGFLETVDLSSFPVAEAGCQRI